VIATLQALSVRRATGAADWRAAAELLHEYAGWIRTATTFDPFVEQPSFAVELGDLARHYSTRDVALFIAHLGGQPVGTVAIACHPDRSAELKRMYVRPIARRQGVADALLSDAITLAARRKCTHVWLETVRGPMDAAIAVYHRNGFRIVEDADPTIDVRDVVVMRRAATR
jgi:GNAT superfamily N-acetyltransferase